jgi:hypothetical protein
VKVRGTSAETHSEMYVCAQMPITPAGSGVQNFKRAEKWSNADAGIPRFAVDLKIPAQSSKRPNKSSSFNGSSRPFMADGHN